MGRLPQDPQRSSVTDCNGGATVPPPHAVGYSQAGQRTPHNRNPEMFTSWAVAPKANPEDKEYFTSESHAVDVAYDWSIESHGRPMIVFCNDQEWMEVIA